MLFTYAVPAILRYRLNLTALASAPNKIVLVAGRVGRERHTPVYQRTAVLAERLGTEVALFPGNHTGCISLPRASATRLGEALRNLSEKASC